MSVHQSIWKGTVWLLSCSRLSSQKHPRERSGRGCSGCCESWHCLPVPELLGGHRVSTVMTMALCLPTDGAVLGARREQPC